ncbi:MAG: PEP-CTERM system histidine kinase PrsK [Exilibacterium sp.]
MGYNSVTYTTYLSAGILWGVLSCLCVYQYKNKAVHWSLGFASLINTVWLLAIAIDSKWSRIGSGTLLLLEIFRYGGWIVALTGMLTFFSGHRIPLSLSILLGGSWVLALGAAVYSLSSNSPKSDSIPEMIWLGLFLSIVGLIGVEQLYKNTAKNRQIKLLGLNLGAMFIFDIYLYSHSLIFSQINPDIWQARAVVTIAVVLFIAVGDLALPPRDSQPSALSISRPIIFYTTSLTAAGGFITVLALGGYYVKLYGGNWGTVIYTLLLFTALMIIAITFASSTVREIFSVLISKHLFRHKYDYRAEWLKLINQLSQPTNPKDIYERTINAVASIFKSPGGAIWMRKGRMMTPIYHTALNIDFELPCEPLSTAFCYTLRDDEWVFAPHSTDNTGHSQYNEYLPEWVACIPDLWIIFPLLVEHELIGFMALTRPKLDSSLTWEDLDLLKTVGRQIASYLERHKQAEQLAESRQFDAFNKLAAFIMHDLKNLIAQQALVVRNAAKHKDNPAFFEDAIHTIENSVYRMNNLLRKLQQHEPEEIRILSLKEVVIEAVKKCQDEKPIPTLRMGDSDSKINADQDRLVMTFTHLIKNAQDATPPNGFIDVTLRNDDKIATITIEDNGSGMDEDFLRNRLFKPFDTTKTGKGMGIGVYQAREYIASLGGTLTVSSAPKEGSLFTITLSAVKTD